ncbi:poly(A) polymerase I precursor [bacterium BMS3Bbin08]|nr:poly(A) polymerase I precursor [bacterium BMS3Bbin08]HDH49926.1 CBS domain-containing protein [Nitrospirota bacterium]
MDVITTHINADFDAVASMVAAKKIYPEAVLVFSGSQERSVRDFLSTSPVTVEFKRVREIDLEKVSRLILVDVNKRDRIGRFSELLDKKGMIIHVYDTHPPASGNIKGQKEVIEHVSATTTVFVEILQKRKREISPVEATILALGIYEETGSLIFSSTTARDISAAAYLVKRGANLNVVSSFISRGLGAEEIDLLNELVHSARDYVIHGIRIKVAKASREAYIGDIAHLAHKFRDSEDVDVVFLLVMMEDRIQVIARSRVVEADLSKILSPLGGGGHPAAASGVVKGKSLEETEETLLNILKEQIKPAKTAKDIMTRPVKGISPDDTIRSAERTLTRYEVNVLPVIEDDLYKGIISREVVEKALFHGFGSSKVAEFCTTDALTVTPDTAMNEVESLMVEQNQRFMPVIENRRITGAITRTDLLRSLYEDILRKSRIGKEPLQEKTLTGRNLASGMREKLPADIFELLSLSGETAKQLSFSAYLVGGCVRDFLRGEENLDIDIVIEGDGIRFARSLGRRLGAKVKSHSRFGTAVVIKGALKFDVATARTEYYESPGMLPRVEMSSIKKDLYRRDFTINTLAIKLDPENFGQLIDFFGGQRDLKEKTIRILHNLSFIEDPTRVFRAIRFSERFGFKISKHTKNLIKLAVNINLFDKLSGTRLYDELNLLFIETEPLEAVKRLLEFDLLKFIHPDVSITRALEETFKDIQETYAWFKLLFLEEELNKSHLILMALIEGLRPEEREKVLRRLSVPKKAREEMLESIEQFKKTLSRLQATSWQEKDIYYALHPLSLQSVLFTIAKARDKKQKKALSSYLTTLRKIKPSLTGKDLKTLGYAPGPLFNKILRAVLDERLNGKVKSREEEMEFVKKEFPV